MSEAERTYGGFGQLVVPCVTVRGVVDWLYLSMDTIVIVLYFGGILCGYDVASTTKLKGYCPDGVAGGAAII